MKKNFQPAVLLAFILFAFSSCTTTKTSTADYDYLFITKQGIIQKPLIADLEVSQTKSVLTRSYQNISISTGKENVMGEFITQFRCDLIVQPYFITSSTTSSGNTTIMVTVSGYAASYKNIRQFERKDTAQLLPLNYLHNGPARPLSTSAEITPTVKKNSGVKLLATLLGIGLIAAVAATRAN